MFNELIYKTGLFFRNRKIVKNLEFLLESQHWSLDELKRYQFEKLSSLISEAYNKSPYYRSLFEEAKITPSEIKSLTDIELIPPTNKADLLTNKSDIQITINTEKSFYSETSGSTGEPLVFYRNQDWDAWHNASVFRGYHWHGVNPWDRNGYLWGHNSSLRKTIITKLQDFLQNRFRLFTYSDNELNQFCKKLKKAKYLNGYSSMIYELAKRIDEDPKLKQGINLSFIKGTSEKIFDVYQEMTLRAFGKRMVSEYGAAEAGIIAFECPHGNMHVNMETVIVEQVEDKILVTNLVSRSFPIIRYELGDYIRLNEESNCPCGRKSMLIKEVTGRVGKNIYGNDNLYPSLTIYYIFKNLAVNQSIVLNYMVIQKEKGAIEMYIESRLSPREREHLDSEIVNYFGEDIVCNIHEEQNLASESGKRKDFISEIDGT